MSENRFALDRFEPTGGTTVFLPRTNGEWDGGTGAPVEALVDLLGGGAWDAWGDQIALPGSTVYKLKAAIWTVTKLELETRLRELFALRGKSGKLYRRWPSGQVDWVPARCLGVVNPAKNSQVLQADVEMSFRTTSPVWNADRHSPDWRLDEGKRLDTGYILGAYNEYVLTGGSDTFSLPNGGTQPVRDILLEFDTFGAEGSITLSAPNSKCYWSYFGALANGTTLTVDCGAPSIYLNGTPDFAHFARLAAHDNDYWLELLPGDNPITITWTGVSSTLVFRATYYDAVE